MLQYSVTKKQMLLPEIVQHNIYILYIYITIYMSKSISISKYSLFMIKDYSIISFKLLMKCANEEKWF